MSILTRVNPLEIGTQSIINNGQLLEDAAKLAKATNIEWTAKLGIKPVARICTDEPNETTSALLTRTSRIHAAHDPHHQRRVRIEIDTQLSTSFLSLIHFKQVLPSSTLKKYADTPDTAERVLDLCVLDTNVYTCGTAEMNVDGATNVAITIPIKMR
ncbi:hypothetical protein BLNAU_14436 [Blattamonas nauphoetae]|uniref:Uncharacterized protein n=1 Tax=Blattamonas nauphoetae TaxID=2049346 RepID=A0ABQ9XGT2_9EUKA|nr:hypothetical protein BLNAU_14436 [Blattamonas nauphoetae]